MQTNTLIEPGPAVKSKLRWFTLYADFPAGVRAKQLIGRMSAAAGNAWSVSAEMWKLDSVPPVGAIRDMIAQEAGEADVLLLAISGVDQPDATIGPWLDTLVNWKANRLIPGLLLGLLGDEERRAGETNWMVEELVRFAGRTQMDLAWHSAGRDRSEDWDWPRAALEKLLDRKRMDAAWNGAPNVTPS